MPILKKLAITHKEFEVLKNLQVRRRWDWPTVFSTNCRGEIWGFATYSWTKLEEREYIHGVSSIIDRVAEEYLNVRADGGRFFIDDEGAFHKAEPGSKVQFICFEISN
jgi:hypothetical protein